MQKCTSLLRKLIGHEFRFSMVTQVKGENYIEVSLSGEMELRIVGLQYTLSDMGKTFNYVYNWFPIDF